MTRTWIFCAAALFFFVIACSMAANGDFSNAAGVMIACVLAASYATEAA